MSREPQWMANGEKPPKYEDIKQIMTEFKRGQIDIETVCHDLDQIEANNEEVESVEMEMNT